MLLGAYTQAWRSFALRCRRKHFFPRILRAHRERSKESGIVWRTCLGLSTDPALHRRNASTRCPLMSSPFSKLALSSVLCSVPRFRVSLHFAFITHQHSARIHRVVHFARVDNMRRMLTYPNTSITAKFGRRWTLFAFSIIFVVGAVSPSLFPIVSNLTRSHPRSSLPSPVAPMVSLRSMLGGSSPVSV